MNGEFQEENMELLEVKEEPSGTIPKNEPRRNTKKDLIAKIKALCDEHEIPLHESDTALQRTSKVGLQKLLAKKTEDVIEKKMKNSVRSQKIEQSECAREHMAVATLGYGLTVLNKMIDKTANSILPRAGYKLDGFMEAFDDPRTQEEVREILLCITRENPEIIQHIANPYVRLGIVYVGCVSMSLRKITPRDKYAKVEPRRAPRPKAVRHDNGRQPKAGQKLPVQPPMPRVAEEKTV